MDIIAKFFACFSQKLAPARKNSTNWSARSARFCNSGTMEDYKLNHDHHQQNNCNSYPTKYSRPFLFFFRAKSISRLKIEKFWEKKNVVKTWVLPMSFWVWSLSHQGDTMISCAGIDLAKTWLIPSPRPCPYQVANLWYSHPASPSQSDSSLGQACGFLSLP